MVDGRASTAAGRSTRLPRIRPPHRPAARGAPRSRASRVRLGRRLLGLEERHLDWNPGRWERERQNRRWRDYRWSSAMVGGRASMGLGGIQPPSPHRRAPRRRTATSRRIRARLCMAVGHWNGAMARGRPGSPATGNESLLASAGAMAMDAGRRQVDVHPWLVEGRQRHSAPPPVVNPPPPRWSTAAPRRRRPRRTDEPPPHARRARRSAPGYVGTRSVRVEERQLRLGARSLERAKANVRWYDGRWSSAATSGCSSRAAGASPLTRR